MKYFTALADSTFARSAFSAAGLDFDAAVKAGNVDVLKKSADLTAAEGIIAQAKTENDALAAQLAELPALKISAAKFEALAKELDAAGLDSSKPVKEQFAAAVTVAARNVVAAAGHPGVAEPIANDATKTPPVAPNLTGRDRVVAAFKAKSASAK